MEFLSCFVARLKIILNSLGERHVISSFVRLISSSEAGFPLQRLSEIFDVTYELGLRGLYMRLWQQSLCINKSKAVTNCNGEQVQE